MKQTITPEEFLSATNVNRILIECIFAQEASFKKYLIEDLNYRGLGEDFEIERVHLSGHRCRVTVRFSDYSEICLYVGVNDVYDWYCEEHKRLEEK